MLLVVFACPDIVDFTSAAILAVCLVKMFISLHYLSM